LFKIINVKSLNFFQVFKWLTQFIDFSFPKNQLCTKVNNSFFHFQFYISFLYNVMNWSSIELSIVFELNCLWAELSLSWIVFGLNCLWAELSLGWIVWGWIDRAELSGAELLGLNWHGILSEYYQRSEWFPIVWTTGC
jgi:hypothetical protein